MDTILPVNGKFFVPDTAASDEITDAADLVYLSKVYPNPAQELLHVDLKTPVHCEYKLYDGNGRLQLTGIFESSSFINVGNLPAGTYTLKLMYPASDDEEIIRVVKL